MNNMYRGGIMDLLYKKKLAGTSNKSMDIVKEDIQRVG